MYAGLLCLRLPHRVEDGKKFFPLLEVTTMSVGGRYGSTNSGARILCHRKHPAMRSMRFCNVCNLKQPFAWPVCLRSCICRSIISATLVLFRHSLCCRFVCSSDCRVTARSSRDSSNPTTAAFIKIKYYGTYINELHCSFVVYAIYRRPHAHKCNNISDESHRCDFSKMNQILFTMCARHK